MANFSKNLIEQCELKYPEYYFFMFESNKGILHKTLSFMVNPSIDKEGQFLVQNSLIIPVSIILEIRNKNLNFQTNLLQYITDNPTKNIRIIKSNGTIIQGINPSITNNGFGISILVECDLIEIHIDEVLSIFELTLTEVVKINI
jgi:hypothetical protein